MSAFQWRPRITAVAAAIFLSAGVATLAAAPAFAAPGDRSSDGVWTEATTGLASSAAPGFLVDGAAHRVLTVDAMRLEVILDAAPREFLPGARAGAPTLTLPLPSGGFARFRVLESPILEGKLASERPDISTFTAQGIDDPTATARLDLTPDGFHAMVRSVDGLIYVDPIESGGTLYRTFAAEDRRAPDMPFICTAGEESGGSSAVMPDFGITPGSGGVLPILGGGIPLRTYRLAIVVSGEYHNFFGGVAGAQNGIVTTINRVNGIYENDVAVRFNLTSTTIFTNPLTDPFIAPNDISGAQLDRVDSLLDADVGTANYDLGHYMSAGGSGGRAGQGPCTASKGRGGTSRGTPQGDAFDVDFVAHEIGHQMGGNHTFNGTTGSCGGGNRVDGAAYEPGSGTTIMAYAGICDAEDVQPNSHAYFHLKSLQEILGVKLGYGAACGTATDTNNDPPSANAGADRTVPRGTAFTLTGSGGDPNGDAITYCWEEFDLGAATPPGNPATSPIFRSRPPTTAASRTFPRLSDLFAGTVSAWEQLPTANRVMNMQLTVRDNRAGGGGVANEGMLLTVAGDPFRITSPNGGESLVAGCATTVSWDVGGGSIAAQVDIRLTTDDGANYTTLLAATANDGSAQVTLPCNVASNNARIRIDGVGQVFFDISDGDFTISATAPQVIAQSATSQVVDGACDALVPFSITFRDDCSLLAANVSATVSNPTSNALLGAPTIVKTQVSATEVRVDVDVPVMQITGCPATVRVAFAATDNCGNTSERALEATVSDTEDPAATASATGGDVDATCAYLMPFSGTLTDNCTIDAGDVTVTITNPGNNATLGVPTINKVQVNPGRVDVTGTVLVSALTSCPAVIRVVIAGADACGNTDEAQAEAEVYDRIAPTIDVVLNRNYLWPPNHSLADIVAQVTIADNCPNPTFVLTSVTSNEPENDLGDGNFAPDIVGAAVGTADTEFQLRSERMGPRSGREYTIVYTASDQCGNSTSKTVRVRVAHDQSATMVAWADPEAMTASRSGDDAAIAPPLAGDRGSFAIVVRSVALGEGNAEAIALGSGVSVTGGLAFDARTAIAGEALIGHVGGVHAPFKNDLTDADGDGLLDAVFYFDSETMNALAQSANELTGPLGFHLGTSLGESFLFENLLAIGAPLDGARIDGGGAIAAAGTAGTAGADVLAPGAALPSRTALLGARPTPFRTTTSIAFDLAHAADVSIEVWNVRGVRVRNLAAGSTPAGRHTLAWDGRDEAGRRLPAGLYWIRFTGDGTRQVMKAMLVE